MNDASRPVALVTGASSGIGLDLARMLAADRHDLILVARRNDKLEALGKELAEKHGIVAEPISTDLSEPGAADVLAREVERGGRTVDVLVNNAGCGLQGAFVDTDVDAERRMLQLNVTTLTDLTKHYLPGMVKRGRGRILNVASTAGFFPGPLMAVYYASKAYVISFSQAVAEEVRGTGVTITVLCPGATSTEFASRAGNDKTPLFQRGRVMESEDVARAGYEAMRKGHPIAIVGAMNWLQVQGVRLAPRGLLPRIVKGFNVRKDA